MCAEQGRPEHLHLLYTGVKRSTGGVLFSMEYTRVGIHPKDPSKRNPETVTWGKLERTRNFKS